MKKIFALLSLAAMLVAGCMEKDLQNDSQEESRIFTASFEDQPDTKTYVDSDLYMFWTADDRLSIFTTTYNQQYKFMGETGATAGDFEEVTTSGFHSGNAISTNYAVYPYSSTTALTKNEKITVNMPAVQNYAEGSFGLGANTMVAVTARPSDTFLPFKNLCGYLVVKLYGSGTVKSVTIEGNNGEKLAGKATVTASHTAVPSLVMADDATTSITIDCGEGVTLGSTAEAATEFWFCIPPVTFSKGFTITATGSAGTFSKSTTGSRTIERNVRVSMPALEFIPDGPAVPEMVDLGLSVKWATCNLGASNPEEYGGYYQWAGLQDVTDKGIYVDWDNCPYHTGSSEYTGWTKYMPLSSYWSGPGNPDNNTILDSEDDVAHVTLGGKWRMPTVEEFSELKKNCQSEIVTYKGVKGVRFTSIINGNSIFLPAAGSRRFDGGFVGSSGYYWSSSLVTIWPYNAYDMFFTSSNDMFLIDDYRYSGQSVRPVYGDLVKATGISLNKTSESLSTENTIQLTATLTPSNCTEKGLLWNSSNTSVATVSVSGLVTAKSAGTAVITVSWVDDSNLKATCTVTVTRSYPDFEMVDLGLSVKWASFNLGATKPEEYGGYYQWAGTQDVTNTSIYLDYSNCPYHTGSSSSSGWTKYVPSNKSSYWSGVGRPDNKTVLNPENDVAHVKLGGKWRIPTNAEFTELINNCTAEWTTLNGVNGRKFTSKIDGYTDKWIFLPATGYRDDVNLYYVGSFGYYWSSSLNTDFPFNANNMYFDSDHVIMDTFCRFCGFSARPVYGDWVKATSISLNKTSESLPIGSAIQLTASLNPSNCAEKGLLWSSSNTSVATVSESGLVTAKSLGTAVITVSWAGGSSIQATCTVTVTRSYPVPEMVDLGLSVKWASFNLGATKPEEYGGYYQWAGTQDVTDTSINLDYSKCPYHTGSSSSSGWMKYVPSNMSSYWSGSGSPDNKTILDPEDDVAHVKLGGKWRMPTEAELQELIDNCSSEWTTLNGVKGRKFTSKKNGNSIFLPAAGHRNYEYLYNFESYGYYWSSSLDTFNPNCANELFFYSDFVNASGGRSRCNGQSVRPVSE